MRVTYLCLPGAALFLFRTHSADPGATVIHGGTETFHAFVCPTATHTHVQPGSPSSPTLSIADMKRGTDTSISPPQQMDPLLLYPTHAVDIYFAVDGVDAGSLAINVFAPSATRGVKHSTTIETQSADYSRGIWFVGSRGVLESTTDDNTDLQTACASLKPGDLVGVHVLPRQVKVAALSRSMRHATEFDVTFSVNGCHLAQRTPPLHRAFYIQLWCGQCSLHLLRGADAGRAERWARRRWDAMLYYAQRFPADQAVRNAWRKLVRAQWFDKARPRRGAWAEIEDLDSRVDEADSTSDSDSDSESESDTGSSADGQVQTTGTRGSRGGLQGLLAYMHKRIRRNHARAVLVHMTTRDKDPSRQLRLLLVQRSLDLNACVRVLQWTSRPSAALSRLCTTMMGRARSPTSWVLMKQSLLQSPTFLSNLCGLALRFKAESEVAEVVAAVISLILLKDIQVATTQLMGCGLPVPSTQPTRRRKTPAQPQADGIESFDTWRSMVILSLWESAAQVLDTLTSLLLHHITSVLVFQIVARIVKHANTYISNELRKTLRQAMGQFQTCMTAPVSGSAGGALLLVSGGLSDPSLDEEHGTETLSVAMQRCLHAAFDCANKQRHSPAQDPRLSHEVVFGVFMTCASLCGGICALLDTAEAALQQESPLSLTEPVGMSKRKSLRSFVLPCRQKRLSVQTVPVPAVPPSASGIHRVRLRGARYIALLRKLHIPEMVVGRYELVHLSWRALRSTIAPIDVEDGTSACEEPQLFASLESVLWACRVSSAVLQKGMCYSSTPCCPAPLSPCSQSHPVSCLWL